MSNYRRLISYIYAYEGANKGKNIGYAKIEVRSGLCRIQANVKKVYVGSSEIGVYLLAPETELLLGRIFIRNGSGEFRAQVNPDNIEGSGCSIEQCYGLTIHDVESAWQSYTTIWEDAVAQAAEVQLAEVTAEHVRREEASEPVRFPVSAEIERELEQEQQRLEATAPWETAVVAEAEVAVEAKQAAEVEPERARAMQVTEVAEQAARAMTPEGAKQGAEVAQPEGERQAAEMESPNSLQGGLREGESPTPVSMPDPDPTPTERPSAALSAHPAPASAPTPLPEPEDPAKLEELDRQEQASAAGKNLWSSLQRRYAKVLAFDYDNGCEILSIKPQDIGLLPREIWVYGNNSFLLHGYYNYRHLILARLNNPQGTPRYLLGVPGHYFSNEKYMASMFGFPHFVLAKKQPEADGRFGYWYTDIRL